MDSRVYWIWLQSALGCGSPHAAAILNHFATPEQAYEADADQYRQAGVAGSALKRLQNKQLDAAQTILHKTLQMGDWILTPADACYPSLLRGIFAPPLVLYGRGVLPDFEARPLIAIVGPRRPTDYGLLMTGRLAAGLTAGGAQIVSGGAVGIDAMALSTSIEYGGQPISIQACGLDVNYPKDNEVLRYRLLEQGGTLLTEYPPGTGVKASTFRVRNRLISGISMGVCVPEASRSSGSLITAGWAREQGRDVFAVPGEVTSANSAGTNRLISQGARLVENAQEILLEYQPLFPKIVQIQKANEAFEQYTLHKAQPLRIVTKPVPSTTLKVAQHPPVPLKTGRDNRQEGTAAMAAPRAACPASASPAARALYVLLTRQPCPADELAAAAGLTVAETLAALTELELLGCAACHAGQQYSLPD